MFATPDMQAILQDPIKWRETVKEGFAGLMGATDDNIKTEL